MRGDRGRYFTPRYDLKRMDRDIDLHQRAFGTAVDWYFYDAANSVFDEIYGEGQDAAGIGGRRWRGPIRVPVLSANRREGQKTVTEDGMYVLDTIDLRLSYEQSRRVGLQPEMSQNQESHYSDRFVYDDLVWGIRDISITGQFEPSGRDIMIRVLGVRLRPDELVNDPDFGKWANAGEHIATGGELDINIVAGETYDLALVYQDDDGAPAPLADFNARMEIQHHNSSSVLLELTSDVGGGITLAPVGDIDIVMSASQTATLAQFAGSKLPYKLDLISNTDPDQVDRLINGLVTVKT